MVLAFCAFCRQVQIHQRIVWRMKTMFNLRIFLCSCVLPFLYNIVILNNVNNTKFNWCVYILKAETCPPLFYFCFLCTVFFFGFVRKTFFLGVWKVKKKKKNNTTEKLKSKNNLHQFLCWHSHWISAIRTQKNRTSSTSGKNKLSHLRLVDDRKAIVSDYVKCRNSKYFHMQNVLQNVWRL